MSATRIAIGGKYLLYRDKARGWGMVEVIGHQGDWLVRVREVVGGLEYPADPCNLRTIREASAQILRNISRAGSCVEVRSNSVTFTLKRHPRSTFSLFKDGVGTRSRWGTKDEILADLATVLEFGVLPTPEGPVVMDEVTTKLWGDLIVIHEWNGLEVEALTPTMQFSGYIRISPFIRSERGKTWLPASVDFPNVEFGTPLHRATEALFAGEVLQTIDWLQDHYPEETAALTAYLEERLAQR